MRIANLSGRLVVLEGDLAVDVEAASGGHFAADPQAVFDRWDEFRGWIAGTELPAGERFDPLALGAPSPQPRQVFAIGLNYGDHASEVGLDDAVASPPVFTKFPTSITGPFADVEHPGGNVDWEVELVVVIGRRVHRAGCDEGWDAVAGLTVGQDISERILQHSGTLPQFSMGKSYVGFGPTGPALVTPDELEDRDDLELSCAVNGEQVQHATTAQLILGVPQLVERLSAVAPLLPGDLIFTGTPAGVGLAHKPPRFLSPGDEVVSRIEGIGEIRNRIVERSLAA